MVAGAVGIAGALGAAWPAAAQEPGAEGAVPRLHGGVLESGLELLVAERSGDARVAIDLRFPATPSPVPGSAGTLDLLAELLPAVTSAGSAAALGREAAALGGSLEIGSGPGGLAIRLVVDARHLAPGLALVAGLLSDAPFPPEEVDRARTRLAGLLGPLGSSPEALARWGLADALRGLEPGAGHPTPEGILAIEAESLEAARGAVVSLPGARLVVAGPVAHDAVVSGVARAFAGVRTKTAEPPVAPRQGGAAGDGPHRWIRPGSGATVGPGFLAAGIRIPGHEADARFALRVAARLAGGTLAPEPLPGDPDGWTFRVEGPEPAGAGGGGSRAVEARLEALRSGPLPDSEVARAVQAELDRIDAFLASPEGTASLVHGLPRGALATDALARERSGLAAVGPEEVHTVARDHLDPRRLLVVVAPGGSTGVQPRPDGTRLEEGVRRYEIQVGETPVGSLSHRLERSGGSWSLSVSHASSLLGAQQTVLRFDAESLRPVHFVQRGTGPAGDAEAAVRVVDGRIRGSVTLPQALGGTRDLDLPAGDAVFPGMDELLLSVHPLEVGLRVRIPVLDLVSGRILVSEAWVEGLEEVEVPAGRFRVWRVLFRPDVEEEGDPVMLLLRADPPHFLVEQRFSGDGTVRIVLSGVSPL